MAHDQRIILQDFFRTKNIKILIIRTSAMGDIIFSLPVLYALKETFPESRIDWIVEHQYQDLIAGAPQINQIIDWNKQKYTSLRSVKSVWGAINAYLSLRKTLRAHKYDLAIDLQGLLKSGLIAWASGARIRIGLGSKEGSQYLMTHHVTRDASQQDSFASEYFDFIKRTSLASPKGKVRVPSGLIHNKNFDELRKIKYIVFVPFTTRPQKHWFLSSWVSLVKLIATWFSGKIIVLGVAQDYEDGEVIRNANSSVINLCGQTTIGESIELVNNSVGLVGVDTGLTHAAVMNGLPTVAIFGSTRPYLSSDNLRAQILYRGLACSPCRRHPSCNGEYTCMSAILPAEVDNLLKKIFIKQ